MKNAIQFLGQVKLELMKVEWPSFQEWIGATMVVLFLVVLFSLYLGAVDRGIVYMAKYIFTFAS